MIRHKNLGRKIENFFQAAVIIGYNSKPVKKKYINDKYVFFISSLGVFLLAAKHQLKR